MSGLIVRNLVKEFGGLRALDTVSFRVDAGAIFGLIGPNGAGKTTVFNVITGVYDPEGGQVFFDGNDISHWPPAKVAAHGVARTFQNIRLFRSMTVEENVMVAGHRIRKANLVDAVLRTRAFRRDEREFARRSAELLEVMGLRELASEQAGSLPYGLQRRLEIARALMLDPTLLLLDEPAAGMNSKEAVELEDRIRFLRDELGVTVLLVEHNMSVVMTVCERIHVLDHGETIAEGRPEQIKEHPKVLAAYLGEESPEEAVDELRSVESSLPGSMLPFLIEAGQAGTQHQPPESNGTADETEAGDNGEGGS